MSAEYWVKLNDLGRRAFPKAPERLGEWLGEAVIRHHPTKWQLPRWRVRWDGQERSTTVLKAYVEFEGDRPPENMC